MSKQVVKGVYTKRVKLYLKESKVIVLYACIDANVNTNNNCTTIVPRV